MIVPTLDHLLKCAFEYKRLAYGNADHQLVRQLERMARLCTEAAVEKIEVSVIRKRQRARGADRAASPR